MGGLAVGMGLLEHHQHVAGRMNRGPARGAFDNRDDDRREAIGRPTRRESIDLWHGLHYLRSGGYSIVNSDQTVTVSGGVTWSPDGIDLFTVSFPTVFMPIAGVPFWFKPEIAAPGSTVGIPIERPTGLLLKMSV